MPEPLEEEPLSQLDAWSPLAVALRDYQKGTDDAALVVSSDLWEDEVMPARDYYRPHEIPLPAIDRAALDRCCGRVIDVGAGAGRHAIELERRGHDVVALDLCPAAVEVMRHRGVRGARCGDMWTIARDGGFDTALMLMHGIGVVGDLAGLGRFLERLPALMAPGGQLLCDSADIRHLVDPRSGAGTDYVGEVTFQLSYNGRSGPPYPWLFVDPDTLSILADAAGWTTEIVMTDDSGAYLARLAGHEALLP